ncbi:MAG: DedA family protein [Candidatus Peribacteraceae bacterium]|nr:DedA family protein [Candidatus Peribacteraceae bacterium]
MLSSAIDLFLHVDVHLEAILQQYGALTYAILSIVILCETGLVVTPFLPGDSLLFAAGAFAGKGLMDPLLLFVILSAAAIIGDSVNFAIGAKFGHFIENADACCINKQYLVRTKEFYARHGGKTIVIARFMPIIRTFAPFVAGMGSMAYGRFLAYNIFGGILWVLLFVGGGYFFGTVPFVQHNFSIVILAIIIISILPGIIGWAIERMKQKKGE